MYCIDTSALIHGWRRDYPPDVFRSLWEQLDQLIRQGKLFSSIEVLLELERGGDDIYGWAKERKHIFLEADEEVQKVLAAIVGKFPSFVPQDSPDGIWADPYVIAIALHTKEPGSIKNLQNKYFSLAHRINQAIIFMDDFLDPGMSHLRYDPATLREIRYAPAHFEKFVRKPERVFYAVPGNVFRYLLDGLKQPAW